MVCIHYYSKNSKQIVLRVKGHGIKISLYSVSGIKWCVLSICKYNMRPKLTRSTNSYSKCFFFRAHCIFSYCVSIHFFLILISIKFAHLWHAKGKKIFFELVKFIYIEKYIKKCETSKIDSKLEICLDIVVFIKP